MKTASRPSSALLVVALLTFGTSGARAEPFTARGFVTHDATSGFVLDEPRYGGFLQEVLGAIRPRFSGTGSTAGAAGAEMSVGFGWSPVSPGSTRWRSAMGDDAPDALLPLLLSARKGLPAGFELGAQLVLLSQLDVASPSIELRWAIIEGHAVIPDIGMRLDAGAVLGNTEATIAHGGLDFVLGREISVEGLMTIGPYGGYAFRYGRTLDRQVALFDEGEAEPFKTVLPGQNLFLHHFVLGLRLSSRPLVVTSEAHLGTTAGLHLAIGARF